MIMTPTRKVYLYQLSDISEHSHTGDYLSSVIEKVIVDIGVDLVFRTDRSDPNWETRVTNV